MTLQSAPHYWITCDATDCDERTYGQDFAMAWETIEDAERDARDHGWRHHISRWFCNEHPDCPQCGKPVDDPDMVWADDQLWHQACMPGGAPVGMVQQLIADIGAAERGAYPQRVWVGDPDGVSE